MSPRAWISLTLSGVFLFLLDQSLKYAARTNPAQAFYIIKPWLGWEHFENPGIAFSLPLPNALLIILTPVILLLLIAFLTRQKHAVPAFGLILILAGALSNFLDRFLFGATIDYIRVATGVFNVADVLIVVGGLLSIIGKNSSF